MKKIALPLVIIALALTGLYLVFFDASEKEKHLQYTTTSEQTPELGLIMPPPEQEPKPEQKIDLTKMQGEPDETYELVLTREEEEAIEEWQAKVGYGEREFSDYNTYYRSDLKLLADQGDEKAAYVLGKLFAMDSNVPELEKYLLQAGVDGNIAGLKTIGHKYNWKYLDTKNPEDELKGFAYLQLAHKRGDMMSHYEMFGLGVDFDNAQAMAEINTLADKLYVDLARERAALGLPEFDNSYPPAIAKVVHDYKVNGCASKKGRIMAYQGQCSDINLKP